MRDPKTPPKEHLEIQVAFCYCIEGMEGEENVGMMATASPEVSEFWRVEDKLSYKFAIIGDKYQ